MKTIFIILCLFFLNGISFCQDTIKPKGEKKYKISIKAGGYYKYYFGKRYIDSTPRNPYDDFSLHQYERFTKMPASSFIGGVLFTYKIYKNLSITSGLMYFVRRNIFESKYDTVIKYNAIPNFYSYNDIHNVVKYDYSHTNIELSFFVQYKLGKFNLSGGVHLPLWTYYKAKYTYLVSSSQYPYFSNSAPTSQKTFTNTESPFLSMYFPAFQISYDLRIKNIALNPFLGIDIGAEKSFYLQGGIIIPLLKQNNKSDKN